LLITALVLNNTPYNILVKPDATLILPLILPRDNDNFLLQPECAEPVNKITYLLKLYRRYVGSAIPGFGIELIASCICYLPYLGSPHAEWFDVTY